METSGFSLTAVAAILFYVIVTLLTAGRIRGSRFAPCQRRELILSLAAAAALFHAVVLSQDLPVNGGLDLNFFHALSLNAWAMVVVMMLVAIGRPVETLGVVLYPLAAITLALEVVYPAKPILITGESWQLGLHIALAVLAFSVLSLAAVHAILLAVQNRELHERVGGNLLTVLPPLQQMEALLFQMIGFGFFLLTLALATGLMFVENLFAQHLIHKTVLSMLGWLVFGTLLWGRWRHGWRGKTAVRWTLGAMFLLLLAYFGTKLVLELILHRVGKT
jgi:ABC-type uncharacterized transport system permease subunit